MSDTIEILVESNDIIDISMESPTQELEIIGATRGDDGHTPYIEDGYWFINGVSTGVQSAGEQGIPGVDANYTQAFNVSSSIDVNHNLNKLVSVSIIDSANDEVIGDISYIDPNNIRVVFTSAFSGTIICN